MEKSKLNGVKNNTCLCKNEIAPREFISHAKACKVCQASFGSLPLSIFNAISHNNKGNLKVLCSLLKNGAILCEEKISKESKNR